MTNTIHLHEIVKSLRETAASGDTLHTLAEEHREHLRSAADVLNQLDRLRRRILTVACWDDKATSLVAEEMYALLALPADGPGAAP
jgi:hypothetical protein